MKTAAVNSQDEFLETLVSKTIYRHLSLIANTWSAFPPRLYFSYEYSILLNMLYF